MREVRLKKRKKKGFFKLGKEDHKQLPSHKVKVKLEHSRTITQLIKSNSRGQRPCCLPDKHPAARCEVPSHDCGGWRLPVPANQLWSQRSGRAETVKRGGTVEKRGKEFFFFLVDSIKKEDNEKVCRV